MKFLAAMTLVLILLNIILCPIVSTHISSHEGCMSGFINHTADMQVLLFAIASIFVFSIVFVLISFLDFLDVNILKKSILYIRKIILPDKTKFNWMAILFHAPPILNNL